MRSMEFSGRNIDEAIFHGLNEMGLTIDEVDTEIVQKESKGLFGIGAKNAVTAVKSAVTSAAISGNAAKSANVRKNSRRSPRSHTARSLQRTTTPRSSFRSS